MTVGAAESGAAADLAVVQLRLLGRCDVTVDGEELSAVLPARAPSLLAYLILRPRSAQPRQRVAQALWPESTDGQARTNLRNLLHHLRRSAQRLAALLEVGPTALRWVGGERCEVDVAAFLDALDVADATPAGSTHQRNALREAVRQYDGDLLPDCRDEWLAGDRASLRERYLAALRRLVDLVPPGDASAAADAVTHARELVRLEPLREDHHRLLIGALQAAGDRAGGARAYHDCVTVLRRELGVSPSVHTREAYGRLLADGAAEPVSAAASRTTPLIGRRRELATLIQAWRSVAADGPAFVLVTGEPGVGKTRLVEELAARCAREDAVVVSARCYGGEGELGYSAVIDWLRSPELSAALRHATPADRRQLSRLMPELVPDPARVVPARAAEMDRLLFFDSVVRVLTGSGRPVLLVLDDAHWCDRASMQLVHYLLRQARVGTLLVAATARREEIDERNPLLALGPPLAVLDRFTEIDLHRLDIEDTAALANSLLAVELDDSARRRLHARTEGNPLFVVEAIRAGWSGSGDVGLTPKLQSVIEARLRRLSDPARELVEAAATMGRAFTADLVARVAGRDDLAVVRGLDELWRRGVIVGHGIHEYDFSHGRIRDVIYGALTPLAQQGWHLAVAHALAAGPDADAVSGQIAAHLDAAGRVMESIDWYERAAVQALKRSAHSEAYGLLTRALALARQLPDEGAAPLELRLLAMTPPALGGVDGYASGRLDDYQRRARELATRLGVEVPAPLLRASVMDSLCRDEFHQASDDALRLQAAALQSGDLGLAVESRYLMGIAAFWSGDVATAAARFRQVVAEVDDDGRAAHLVRFGQDPQVVCLSRLANALFFLGDATAARSTVDEALALAERVGDSYTRDVAHIFAALLAVDLADAPLMARAVQIFRDRRRTGFLYLKAEALLGYVDVLDGRAAAGIGRIEEAIRRTGSRSPAPGFVATLHRVLVGALAVSGDAAGGLIAADRALALGGTRLWEAEIARVRQRFSAQVG